MTDSCLLGGYTMFRDHISFLLIFCSLMNVTCSPKFQPESAEVHPAFTALNDQFNDGLEAVSYTHLTLPTILLV